MHDIQQVETILARLMPSALSESGQHEMEVMIDELSKSAPASNVNSVGRSRWHWRIIGGGIAATGMAAALIFSMLNHSNHAIEYSGFAKVDAGFTQLDPGFVLVGESDRVESMTDEGWLEDADGAAMQAMRVHVVAENTLRDEKTGIVMRISEPREELLLMPVSTF